MAATELTLRIEIWPLNDAIDELAGLSEALAHRHGPAFRALDRDVEQLLEELALGGHEPGVEALADATSLILPPPAVSQILRRARTLGVI